MPQSRRAIHETQIPQREDHSQDSNISDSGSDVDYSENDERISHSNTKFQERSRSVSYTPQSYTAHRLRSEFVNECSTNECPRYSKKAYFFIVFISTIILVLAAYLIRWPDQPQTCSFEKFKEKYPKEQSSLWNQLKIGIEMILNKQTEKPAVFLFVDHGEQHAFKLIEDVANHCSSCFGKKLLFMESKDFFEPGEYGHAIEKYKNKIKEGNVFLIANLNEIPAEAARALHAICDTHSPIAKNVVIFLRLTVQGNKKGGATEIAEETLLELWGMQLKYNELYPLITRVTDQVILLKS